MSEFRRENDFEQAGARPQQVTRRRRRSRKAIGAKRAAVVTTTAAVVLGGAGAALATTGVFKDHQVGTTSPAGLQISSDQVIKPIGDRLETQTGKIMGSTVSPDKRYLAATSTDKSIVLQIFDLKTYKEIWSVGKGSTAQQQFSDGTVGQEGPTYSPDGKYLWLGEQDAVSRFPVNADGTLGTPTSFKLPQQGTHPSGNSAMPTPNSALVGQIKYSPDGKTIYAAINGQNTVVAMDPDTGAIEHTWPVGIAPRELQFVGNTLYVTNEGGHQARPGETTMDSYGTAVPANGYLGTSTSGTVSVIDTTDPTADVGSISVGLHPTGMYFQPSATSSSNPQGNGALFVTNTNSDTVSVINTAQDKVVQTIATDPWPSSDTGYEPTSVAMGPGQHLLVTLGRANAVAVYQYHGNSQEPVNYIGLVPTDYYPADVAKAQNQIFVTNTRGVDARGPALTTNKGTYTPVVTGHNTHSTTASLTRFTLPSDQAIAGYWTDKVFTQNGWTKNDVQEATSSKAAPVPVPTRIGDPSTIKHVFLIVKENRGYDQFYGDLGRGNGDRSLTQFGADVTPNQHALAKQFGDYDNFYDVGTNSAEGHNWMMQGDNPEYTESSAGEYQRSYDTEEDVLGHQRSGFLWTAAEDAGKTARDYGEFEYAEGKPAGTWQQYYCAAKSVAAGGDPSQLTTPDLKGNYGSVIPSLNAISDHLSPPFDLTIPDIYRFQIWKQDFEQNGPANLNMFWYSSDHTGGPTTPRSGVADNDLAVGKTIQTISHSKYWKDSVIFVVEDDSQDSADHVDGHRAPIEVISPYAIHNKVDSTYYSQITMVRTIEQILGAQPLNQKVAAATPMYGAFTNTPDMTPFNAVPNKVSLTEAIKTPPACGLDPGESGPSSYGGTAASARWVVPASERATAAAWQRWKGHQRLSGRNAVPDYASPEQMNRYIWYQDHDWKSPYPGDKRIYRPSTVPGGFIPSADSN